MDQEKVIIYIQALLGGPLLFLLTQKLFLLSQSFCFLYISRIDELIPDIFVRI